MATIKLQQPNKYGKAKGRELVENIARTQAKKYNAQAQWEGDNLTFRTSGVNGRIHVADKNISVVIDLGPTMSIPFISNAIRDSFDQQLKAAFQ